jgi:hypothetical protein
MCLSIRRTCACGKEEAQFMHRDNILPEAILVNLYCPECRTQTDWDVETMTEDGGWILEYDMDGAKFLFWNKGIVNEITPDFLFDEGYCSWNGLTPQDLAERTRLHAALAPLLKEDRLAYINKLKETMINHANNLKEAGWRKAQKV